MIELKNIVKKYDDIVLNNVNLKLTEGNIYVIKGISGSGKTTLLNIISLLDSEYTGEYFFDGKNVKKMSKKEKEELRKNVSYVFQKSYLFSKLTIKENLLFINSDIELIKKYAKQFNIIKILDKKAEEVSGGERQRVALVRALITNSKIIVLDEPTSSLDKENSIIFSNYLKELSSLNKIVIISTHKEIFDSIANEIYNIEYGNIVLQESNLNSFSVKGEKSEYIKRNDFKYDYIFVRKRKKVKIMLLSMLLLFSLLILSATSILENIKKEMIKKYSNTYPLHVVNLSKADFDFINIDINKSYYNYKVDTEEFKNFILFDREDSYLKNDFVFKCGNFPNSDNEILVNEEYVNKYLKDDTCKKSLGKSVVINNEIFYVSGIIKNDLNLYYSNEIYKDAIDFYEFKALPSVFIPYNKMKEIGKDESNDIIITISKKDAVDLYINDGRIESQYFDVVVELPWMSIIHNEIFIVYNYVLIIIAILVLISIFIFIFLVSKLSLELFYRKKEIGLLRLYNISNKRIKKIFLIDFFFEILLAIVIAVFLFVAICTYIYLKYDLSFYISLFSFIIITFVIYLYFYLLVNISLSKYLKTDILKYINNN